MRSPISRFAMLAALGAATMLGLGAANAQCTHLTGAPAPMLSPLLASRIVLNAGLGGTFGDGNDRFKMLKGFFTRLEGAHNKKIGT